MGIFIAAVVFLSLIVYIDISLKSLAMNHSKSHLGILDRINDRYKIIAALPTLLSISLVLLFCIFGQIKSSELFISGHGASNEYIPVLMLITLCIFLISDYSVRQRKNTLEYSQEIIDPPRIYKQAKLFANINGTALICIGSICAWFIILKAFG